MADVIRGTPKRKREVQTPLTPARLSFEIANEDAAEDGSNSPRSSVAHRFGGLELGGGYLTPRQEPHRGKRQKSEDPLDTEITDDIPEQRNLFPAKASSLLTAAVVPLPSLSPERGRAKTTTTPKRKYKKRSGTPPLRMRRSPLQDNKNDDNDDGGSTTEVVDPVRASLTWHEDEITIYDPDDEDDDGTGINGVGFKPTPALAHMRALKRQQQMAEYRKREESEARSRRSQRRRDGSSAGRHEEKLAARRVRFLEAERQKLGLTTG